MLLTRFRTVLLLCTAIGGFAPAALAANFDDATNDFSNANLAPTPITLDVGSNVITGTTGVQSGLDTDFFTFTLPPGRRLASVILTANSSSTSFIAVNSGGTIPNTHLGNGSLLLGWEHFHEGLLNTNVLDDMGLNGAGFTPPLPAGTYTFWIQETSNSVKAYGFNFVVESSAAPTPVPSLPPSVLALLAGALLVAGAGAQRRRQVR